MVNMSGYGKKVHRSLLQRELLFGVPTFGLLLIFCLAMVFLYLLRWTFMIVPLIFLYLLLRFLTSKDPWMIEIALDFIQQKDIFIP